MLYDFIVSLQLQQQYLKKNSYNENKNTNAKFS
jgi:hypothetical protein